MLRALLPILLCFATAVWALAQEASDVASLRGDLDALRSEVEAQPDDDARAELLAQLSTTRTRLQSAEDAAARATRFQSELERGPERAVELREELETLRRAPVPQADPVDTMNNARLREAERELAEAESRFSALRTRISTIDRSLQDFAQRPVRIIAETETAQERLARIDEQLSELPAAPDGLDERVRRASLEAARAFRLRELSALEAESASISARLEVLQLERDLAELNSERLALRIRELQALTGQRLMNEAMALMTRNSLALMGATGPDVPSVATPEIASDPHPLLAEFAERNAELIGRLQAIAEAETALPRQRAAVQSSLADVSSNLTIATQLTELGDLDRRAGETLRRLRAAVPVLSTLEAELERTRSQIIEAGQDYLLAQDELRQMPFGRTDTAALLEEFQRSNPDAPPLTGPEAAWLSELYDLRRDTLDQIAKAANARRQAAAALQLLQTDLLEQSTQLQATLDENLLWLPSAEPVWLDWPAKVVRGTLDLATPTKITAVLSALRTRALSLVFLTLVVGIVALGLFSMRANLRASIADKGTKVGRVREDSYFHTPLVILQSFAIALPLPILVAYAGWLLLGAETALPIVRSSGEALVALGGFLFFWLTLRVWAGKGGLFARHVRIPENLRRGIQTETHWFIPIGGTALALLALTRDSRNTDIYEGVSVAAFLVLSLSAGWFFYRLLWGRREAFTKSLDPEGFWFRYRRPLIGLLVGLPFVTALGAALGFFSTADEVFQQVMATAVVSLLTFVVYGTLRRTVNITHRRLSLKQAMEKREAAIEARRREAEAEADDDAPGDVDAPPPVDYEQIDLEQTSRQTRQLVGTLVGIGFVFLAWFIWRDLLPALGALDAVELYQNGTRTVGEGEDALEVVQYITLWDVVQSLVTVALTVLAARNLPGFLEIFVLNRSSMDRGLRYALVTVMGYIIVAIGFVIAFGQLGLQWQQFAIIGGALALGIGFGLGEIISNFISGLIILFERPLRVGDYVTVGDQSGTVSRIKIRATTLTDLDNKEILIPNKEFVTGRVTNWTLSNSILRIIIPVGIAYGSDTRRAQEIMLDVLQSEPKVLDKPAPQAIFVNFGDSSLDFELRVFIRSFEDRFPVINAVHTAINLALERAGITIPFPQRDLHLVSADARVQVSQALEQGSGEDGLPAVGPDPGLAAE